LTVFLAYVLAYRGAGKLRQEKRGPGKLSLLSGDVYENTRTYANFKGFA